MSVISQVFTYFLTDRPSRGKSWRDFADELSKGEQKITQAMNNAADTPANRAQLGHIIGIERWGQSRLQVALGQPFVKDEYDGYRPAADLDMAQLRPLFTQTRQETLAILQKLEAAKVALDGPKVLHNDYGEWPVRYWLRYLTMHGNLESSRLKK